jgi:hypothetical protein
MNFLSHPANMPVIIKDIAITARQVGPKQLNAVNIHVKVFPAIVKVSICASLDPTARRIEQPNPTDLV